MKNLKFLVFCLFFLGITSLFSAVFYVQKTKYFQNWNNVFQRGDTVTTVYFPSELDDSTDTSVVVLDYSSSINPITASSIISTVSGQYDTVIVPIQNTHTISILTNDSIYVYVNDTSYIPLKLASNMGWTSEVRYSVQRLIILGKDSATVVINCYDERKMK